MRRALPALALLLAACGDGTPEPAGPPDASCEPRCASRSCGDDGCGGSCGTCAEGLSCTAAGTCAGATCVPQCSGRQCGPDGCGGSCGDCAGGVCTALGACELPACVPACSAKACGPDGCGGTCGTCASGSTCSEAGRCEPEKLSLNCPAGERCRYEEFTAVDYACTVSPSGVADCQASGQLGTFTTLFGCQNGCRGGNSSCGETHGRNDPLVAACLACVGACNPGTDTLCPVEVEGGCVLGESVVPCACR